MMAFLDAIDAARSDVVYAIAGGLLVLYALTERYATRGDR